MSTASSVTVAFKRHPPFRTAGSRLGGLSSPRQIPMLLLFERACNGFEGGCLEMNRLLKWIPRLGRRVVDNVLLLLPILLFMIPVAAYVQYGPGKELYRALAIMVPVIALASYFMIRFHLEFQEAYKDNSALVARLQQEGRRVKATVLDVSQSNAFINDMPVMKVTIEYNDGHRHYKKTIARVVSYDSLHGLNAGATRWVWVDKNNPRIVVLP